MSIKVGVRVRPFNQRQIELNCHLCVEMQGQTTRLINTNDTSKNRDFAFDYSFWSHDNFEIEQTGYFRPTSKKYADQQHVYQTVGTEILDNAWEGFHCCLFAYGQTGSGKSYSMIGYGANKGIVPIACQQIFKRIQSSKSSGKQYEVQVSMLQIYNQKVQDLLIPVNKRSKEGLKIREHKIYGIYVEGLSKHSVNTYEGIQSWMDLGNTHRSVAATEMNANSSRAHTIISIEFKQKQEMHNETLQRLSVINLVDLAGSQRIQKTGAAGMTLVQATNINKSLTVLGRVIENLADKAIGKGKGTVPPYRQSALTRILQNALGGNSKTLMMCAISPATDNYDQTLSTLKYADQAKKIQNKAIVNQNQTDKMIRQLSEQNQKLKKLMEQFNKMGINLMDEESLKKFNEMKSDFNMNNQMMKDAMTPIKLQKHEQSFEDKIDESKPHLVNLNEDPLLSRKIKYSLQAKEQITIGRKNAEPPNDVIVGGVGIQKHHAIIERRQSQGRIDFYLNPLDKEEPNSFINGELIIDSTRLFHEDRLIFGTASTFLIILPGEDRRIGAQPPKEIDYEFAQQQLLTFRKKQMQKQQRQQKQKQNKQKQQQERKLLEKQLQFQKMKKQLQKQSQKSYQQMQAKTTADKQKYELQLQRMKQQIEAQKKKLQEASKKYKAPAAEQKNILQTKISRYIPKTIQMNLIAKEFNRNINTQLKLSLLPETLESNNLSSNQKFVRIIKIHVENKQLGYNYSWDVDEFNIRYQQVKDLWERYLETNQLPSLAPVEDPFYDPPTELQIGSGFLTTLSLAYLLDNQTELALVHDNGQCGHILVNLIPTDETGEINLSNEMQETQQSVQPEQLIGKPLYFKVIIESAKIPDNHSNIYVEYDIRLSSDTKQTYKTKIIKQKINNPVFNYSQVHKIDCVTKQIVDLILQGHLCFKVFGQQYTNIEPIKKKPQPKLSTKLSSQTKPIPITQPKPQTKNVPMNIQSAQQDMKKKITETKKPSQKKKDDNCLLF